MIFKRPSSPVSATVRRRYLYSYRLAQRNEKLTRCLLLFNSLREVSLVTLNRSGVLWLSRKVCPLFEFVYVPPVPEDMPTHIVRIPGAGLDNRVHRRNPRCGAQTVGA